MKERIKELFFEDSLRRWHFEAIVEELGVSRERVNYFLKGLLNERFIIRIKPRGKMPYYIANIESRKFRSEKKFFGLNLIEKSGLFGHLNSLENIKTAILFGSFARGDWGKSSDIDIFIYGDDKDFAKGEFESKIKREIQLFSYKNPEKIKKGLDPKLLPNIIKGFNIKENLEPFKVIINA